MEKPVVIDFRQACEIFDTHELLEKLVQLDYDTIEVHTPEEEGTVEQWMQVFMHSPETYRILLLNKQIIGYWHYCFLNNETFEKAKKGLLLEGHITPAKMVAATEPGQYDGYFCCLTIAPEHRTARNLMMLFKSFAEQMEEFAKQGIFVREWCTNAYSDEGETMCKMFGHRFLCNNQVHGRVYGSLFRPSEKMSAFKFYGNLIKLYKEYFRY